MPAVVERKKRSEREADRIRKASTRAAARDLVIPKCANPSRRARALKDLHTFLKVYFPDEFTSWSTARREMADAIFLALRTNTAQAIAAPRGDGKTTITIGVLTYCILKGLVKYAVLVGATGGAADDLLENLKGVFERRELLLLDFPEVCIPIRNVAPAPSRAAGQTVAGEYTQIEWSQGDIVFPTVKGSASSGAVVKAVGITGGFRGLNRHFRRPDLVIIDDPDDEESADSEEKTKKRVAKINKTIRGLAGDKSDIARVMLCTLINNTCAAAQYTDRKRYPAWNGRRFRMIEVMPTCCGTDNDLWVQYVELLKDDWEKGNRFGRTAHAFYLENREAMDAGGVAGNPTRFYGEVLEDGTQREISPFQHAFNLIADIGWDAFSTEYQNEPPTTEDEADGKLTAGVVRGSADGYSGRMTGLQIGKVPEGCEYLTAFIDMSKHVLTWQVNAWLPDERCNVVEYGKQQTDLADVQSVPRVLKLALDDVAKHLAKRGYQIDAGLIDSGSGLHTKPVYDWINENGGPWYPSKGEGRGKYRPTKIGKDGKRSSAHWNFSPQDGCRRPLVLMDADFWKLATHASFRTFPVDQDGRQVPKSVRLFGFDSGAHRTFADEIVAEQWVREFVEGVGYKPGAWVQLVKANHCLDTHYGTMVARLVAAHIKRPSPPRSQSTPRMPDGRPFLISQR